MKGLTIPDKILAWREGDAITEEHHYWIAKFSLHMFTPNDEAGILERAESMKAMTREQLTPFLATVISTYSGMDLPTFLREFPNVGANDNSLSTQVLLATKFSKIKPND